MLGCGQFVWAMFSHAKATSHTLVDRHKHTNTYYAKMVAFIAMTEAVWFVDFLATKVEKVPACLSILSHGFGHSRHGVCLSTAWRFLLEGCAASQG